LQVTSISDLGTHSGWSLQEGWNYSAELRIETDDPNVGAKTVADALNLFAGMTYRWPLTKTAVETDPRCVLNDVTLERSSPDGKQWRATLSFKPRSWEGKDPERGPVDANGDRDPFQARPTLRARSEVRETAATVDRDGVDVLNAAGDPFDPPLAGEARTTVFEVSRKERRFDRDRIDDFEGKVNGSTWMGFPAESVKCVSVVGSCEWSDDIGAYLWSVDYQFGYRKPAVVAETSVSGWAEVVLDAGLRQLKDGKLVKILGPDGSPVSKPVPLKDDGAVASPADGVIWKVLYLAETADFSALDLPVDLFSAGTDDPTPPGP